MNQFLTQLLPKALELFICKTLRTEFCVIGARIGIDFLHFQNNFSYILFDPKCTFGAHLAKKKVNRLNAIAKSLKNYEYVYTNFLYKNI